MPGPAEVVDDLTVALSSPSLPIPPTPPGMVFVVRVRKRYIPGSVRAFINGILIGLTGVFELDVAEKLVGISEDPRLDADRDASLHISYLTFDPVFVNPDTPVHISQVSVGDVLRIAMKAGRQLEPRPSRRGAQHRLVSPAISRVARNTARTVFHGYVTGNDPQHGVLNLQVAQRETMRDHFAALVNYGDILRVQKFITPAKVRSVPVGGGPRAVRHPGVQALGVDAPRGFQRLVQVRF
jgi:hypothetical protein